jgi:hypothetical protein
MDKGVTLVTALATLALVNPAAAQQAPGPNGTDANGPITIFRNYIAEPTPVRVLVNGQEIDQLAQAGYDDITATVHTGLNSLTLTWDGAVQQIRCKIAFAPTRNNFRNVLVIDATAQRDAELRQAGSKTLTFTIPR